MQDSEIAHRLKVDVNEVRKNMKYLKGHPHDLMRGSDRNFNKIWGKTVRDNEDKVKRKAEDSRGDYREQEAFHKIPVERRRTYH